MKLDVGLGTEGKYLKRISTTAKSAESLGFDGLWTSETKHDSFLPLAIAADATENIKLGTSVAIAFSRSPMVVAQAAWDLQDLSDGRFILGLGTQVRAHIERRFSMPWGRPVARLREYVMALRSIWESFQDEGSLKFEGEFYRHTLMTPFFNPGPIEHPEIPIYIAGVNTSLAKMTGELCDGFHVHPFHSPEYVRQVIRPAIIEGTDEAGRDPKEVELATSAFVITDDEERESVRQQLSFYASTPTYRSVMEIHGWEDAADELSVLAREKKWQEMPGLVTDEMLSEFAVEAVPDEVGPALKERYEGLIDRVALYIPFVPGKRDDFWRTVVDSTRRS